MWAKRGPALEPAAPEPGPLALCGAPHPHGSMELQPQQCGALWEAAVREELPCAAAAAGRLHGACALQGASACAADACRRVHTVGGRAPSEAEEEGGEEEPNPVPCRRGLPAGLHPAPVHTLLEEHVTRPPPQYTRF